MTRSTAVVAYNCRARSRFRFMVGNHFGKGLVLIVKLSHHKHVCIREREREREIER